MNYVLLDRFKVRAYRSCIDTEFAPNRKISTLIGANGSGKTNIFHALTLLKQARSRGPVSEEEEGGGNQCDIEADFLFKKQKIRYRATLDLASGHNKERISASKQEWSLSESETWFPDRLVDFLTNTDRTASFSNIVRVLSGTPRPSGDKINIRKDRLSLFTSIPYRGPDVSLSKKMLRGIIKINNFRSNIVYYSASQFMNPSSCPTTFEIDEDETLRASTVSRRSSHLSFMFALYKTWKNDPKKYKEFMYLVGPRGVNLINSISWREIPLNYSSYEVQHDGNVLNQKKKKTLVVPTIKVTNSKIYFNQLSDGTFRTLALLFYISTDQSSLLLIEEPEVCVHHGLLRSIVEIISSHSIEKQIMFTTHSDAVVDYLNPDNLFLVKNSKKIGTSIKQISSTMSDDEVASLKDYLRNEGNLGEYWRHGGFQ